MSRYLRWIPVTERLPDEELAAHRAKFGAHEDVGVIVLIEGAAVPYHLYYNGSEFVTDNGDTYDITHWMELPPHPKDCLLSADLDANISANYEEIEVFILSGGH